jgi:hypothetical protein
MGWYSNNKYQRTWRPVSIADANRYSVSWSRRNEAKDRLDDLTFQYQKTAAESALGRSVLDSELKTRPQRGPLHTLYPAFPAARACLGLSAVSEFKAHAGQVNILLQSAVKLSPEKMNALDPNAVLQTSNLVIEAVANCLCIDQLYRMERLGGVESYRLFASAMIDLRFTRLKDVILGACTLGDLIFGLVRQEQTRQRLHPLTCRILEALAPACERYQASTSNCNSEQLPSLGAELAKDIMIALVPFLPFKQTSQPADVSGCTAQIPSVLRRVPFSKHSQVFAGEEVLSRPLAGIDEPMPPSIDEPEPYRLRPNPEKLEQGKSNCNRSDTPNSSTDTGCAQNSGPIHKDAMLTTGKDTKIEKAFPAGQSREQANNRLRHPGSKSQEEAQALSIIKSLS